MEPKTYTADLRIEGTPFTCKRCGRQYTYPKDAKRPIICECGWRYRLVAAGVIKDEFRPRIGQGMDFTRPGRPTP